MLLSDLSDKVSITSAYECNAIFEVENECVYKYLSCASKLSNFLRWREKPAIQRNNLPVRFVHRQNSS